MQDQRAGSGYLRLDHNLVYIHTIISPNGMHIPIDFPIQFHCKILSRLLFRGSEFCSQLVCGMLKAAFRYSVVVQWKCGGNFVTYCSH